MTNRNYLVASLAILFALAGCAGEEAVKPAPKEDKAASAQTGGAAENLGPGGSGMDAKMAELLSQRNVYFAFDSSTIDADSRAIIEAHAKHLSANPNIKVTLSGNCDERGTREYNLALGERRAHAVERMMKALGVGSGRIKTVSYGEEKGVCKEHNESCWRQNRRTEIGY